MANAKFSSEKFNSTYGFQDNFSSESSFYGTEGWGETTGSDFVSSDYELYQGNQWEQEVLMSSYDQQYKQQNSFVDYDDLRFSILSPPLQTCFQEISEIQEVGFKIEKPYAFSLTSLELLKTHNNGFKQFNGTRILEPSSKCDSHQQLSTEEIMRIAGARYLHTSCKTNDVASIFNNPFDLYFSGLSDEDTKQVELAEFLLASAERIGNQQFDRASRLLKQCESLSSNIGNPVQRVVYYFAEALRDRIDIETGKVTSKGLGKKQSVEIDNALMTPNPTILASHQETPFCQVAHFAGIQAIVDNVANAKKVHILDLSLRYGLQWTVLMQALVSRCDCALELLKITAIGNTTSMESIESTGKRLISFAETMNIPFSFKKVLVSDFLDLKEDLLELDDEETVAVYSAYIPRSLISFPNRLDSVMRVIKNVNPCVIVVAEVEANLNSPNFVSRFIEALFFYSAYFDCLDACMERDNENRMVMESMYFGKGIRNAIAAEGDERMIRIVKLDAWRAFFARFGLVETELSSSSIFQANLIVKKFACGNCCTLDRNGKSLILGWKGTPLHSLSAWKFISEEGKKS